MSAQERETILRETEGLDWELAVQLVDRCLRPVVLTSTPRISVPIGSPLPYLDTDFHQDVGTLAGISLAQSGDSVVLDCSVAPDGRIHLNVEVNGRPRGRWILSSTFMIAEGAASPV